MSPYKTNMHPNRKQKNPKFIEIILLSSFLNWTKTFVTQTKWGEKKQKEEKVFLYGPKPLQLSFSWIFLRLATFIYYIFFRTKQNRKKKLPCGTSFNHFKTPGFVKWDTLKPLGSGRGWASGLAPVPMHARCRPASSLHQVCSAGLWMPKCCDGKNVLDWPIEYQYTQL